MAPPPMKVSEEATKDQLEMARQQGAAVGLVHMLTEVADDGKEKKAGDFLVGYAIEDAEGMYEHRGSGLRWKEPGNTNAHIEVSVRDAGDGRFVPGLDVGVQVSDKGGKVIGKKRHPFVWHPWIYHYGANWKLPGPGRYDLDVTIQPPKFMRHDKKNGKRYAGMVQVSFKNARKKDVQG